MRPVPVDCEQHRMKHDAVIPVELVADRGDQLLARLAGNPEPLGHLSDRHTVKGLKNSLVPLLDQFQLGTKLADLPSAIHLVAYCQELPLHQGMQVESHEVDAESQTV